MSTFILGDALETLRKIRDGVFHSCVTSPPYFGLRDYGHEGQIGLEATPDAYVARLVEVFREVRRTLRDDGTLWLNLGDSYARNPAKGQHKNGGGGKQASVYAAGGRASVTAATNLADKQLLGIPWRVAFALQADGWFLRQDIIWSKPNPMPESVTDRCTKSHEYIFMLTKSARYYYDHEAVKEPAVYKGNQPSKSKGSFEGKRSGHGQRHGGFNDRYLEQPFRAVTETRNRRSVWTVTTKPFKGAHFATFPQDLIEPCILAGAPKNCCSKCGAPWVCETIDTGLTNESFKGPTFTDGKTGARDGGDRTQKGARTVKIAGEPAPACKCAAPATSGLVLDPFGGAGTTNLVCKKLGRHGVYIDTNPEYLAMARARVK